MGETASGCLLLASCLKLISFCYSLPKGGAATEEGGATEILKSTICRISFCEVGCTLLAADELLSRVENGVAAGTAEQAIVCRVQDGRTGVAQRALL
jgi:hypothetical protein